jgi:glutamine amidotransferase
LIVILDYGSGNLRSAQRAFASTGEIVEVTSNRQVALEADGLVVPGVGAFRSCMRGLLTIKGDEIIRERLTRGRPTFAICVGMQILFETGLELSREGEGNTAGVGIWPGAISKLTAPILPHVGWNTVEVDANSTLFHGVENQSFYFVHSYAATEPVGSLQAWTVYGKKFLAAVEDGTLCATQFHPEKSGTAGLRLIRNWVAML